LVTELAQCLSSESPNTGEPQRLDERLDRSSVAQLSERLGGTPADLIIGILERPQERAECRISLARQGPYRCLRQGVPPAQNTDQRFDGAFVREVA
jgi:hypothetical protein